MAPEEGQAVQRAPNTTSLMGVSTTGSLLYKYWNEQAWNPVSGFSEFLASIAGRPAAVGFGRLRSESFEHLRPRPARADGSGGFLAPAGGWPAWKVTDTLPAAVANGSTLEGPALFKALSPSVYRVLVVSAEGAAQGSAVAISRSELLTNCHVLQGAQKNHAAAKQARTQSECLALDPGSGPLRAQRERSEPDASSRRAQL